MKITLKENWAEQDPNYIQASLDACCGKLGVSPQVKMWLRIEKELKDHLAQVRLEGGRFLTNPKARNRWCTLRETWEST